MKRAKAKNKNNVDERNKIKFSKEHNAERNCTAILTQKPTVSKSTKDEKPEEKFTAQPPYPNKGAKFQPKNTCKQDADGFLVGYKKEDLSKINYFLPKRNNEIPKQKLKNKILPDESENTELPRGVWYRSAKHLEKEDLIEIPNQKLPTKSFWNRSVENLENDLKKIMIQEKNERKKQIHQPSTGDVSSGSEQRFYGNDSDKQNQSRRNRALSQEAETGYKTLRDSDENKYGLWDLSKSQTNIPYEKPSLYECIAKEKKLKALDIEKYQNKNAWPNLKLEQEKLDAPTDVEVWLQDNKICLHEIIRQEEIRHRQKRSSSSYEEEASRTSQKSQDSLSFKDRTYSLSYLDEWSQDSEISFGEYISEEKNKCKREESRSRSHDIKIPSRKYSIEYLLQDDNDSKISDEWLQENQICLDQIIIEEKIKRKLKRSQKNSETSSEGSFYPPSSNLSTEKITKMPTLLNTLLKAFQLYNMSPSNDPYVLVKLDSSSYEFCKISEMFLKTVRNHKIHCIKKVVNPYLLLHYKLRKETICGEEKMLFHGTKMENVDSICTDNFDWRLVERHKYGWGVSFSSSAYYASHYSDQSASTMAMFVVKVLVGLEWFGNCYTEVPAEPFDTTTNYDDTVYVKFDDCCFYPEYIIYYKDDYK